MRKVTALEPRTPHQPGKPQNVSKNDFLSTLPILGVIEKYRILSPCDAIKCSRSTHPATETVQTCASVFGIACVRSSFASFNAVPWDKGHYGKKSQCGKSQRNPWVARGGPSGLTSGSIPHRLVEELNAALSTEAEALSRAGLAFERSRPDDGEIWCSGKHLRLEPPTA